MKKHLLFVIACISMLSVHGQTTFDYESPESTITFQFFGGEQEGVILESVANPDPSGINTSDTVYPFTELPNGPDWSGGFSNPNPAGGIDATNGGQICIDAYFAEANSLTVKLENQAGEETWEQTQSNDVTDQWVTICFDLSVEGEGNGSVAVGKTYTTFVLFIGLGEAAPAEQVVYIDNITFPEGGGTGGDNVTMILDAETAETTAGLYHFGSTLADSTVMPVANPSATGINESATVFELKRPANSETWAGAFTNPNPTTPINTASGKICLDVYMDHIGTISVKLEDSAGGNANWIQTTANTVVNEWETVCIDFSSPSIEDPFGPALGDVYSRLVFFADFLSPSSDVDVTTYFDNVRVEASNIVPEYAVTFSVDMNNSSETFTQMYVSGTFNEWSGTSNPMSDDDLDGVWTTTLILPVGSYEYKFSYDDWAGSEQLATTNTCTITTDGFTNRIVSVSSDTDLGAVCYASCYACGASNNITWNLAVANPDEGGVFLAGGAEFGAPGGNYQMLDNDGDGVFSITIERPIGYEGYYTFANGNCPDYSCKENIAGQDCARPENFNDRFLDAGTTEINTCFAECTTNLECSGLAEPTMTTFSVDMKNVTEVSADGVFIAGQFSNWGDVAMSDDDADGVWTVTIELSKGLYEYKFKNGVDGWENLLADTPCTITTDDGQFTNRLIDLTEAGDESESGIYCFESCSVCELSSNDLEANNNLIALYPSITQNVMFLDVLSTFNNGTVQIFSLQGELLHTSNIGNNKIGNLIDVTTFSQGTYMLSLTTDTFRSTKRFVKI